MPRFQDLERRERSLILGMWRAARQAPAVHAGASGARWSLFVTLREGMQELVRALAARLPPAAVRLGARVTDVVREGGGWQVLTADGGAERADAVVLACEAPQAARMVRYVDPGLSHLLDGIPYASSATVTLACRRQDVAHPLDGFGFVVPQIERRPIIACTFSSVKYPGRAPEGFVLLRAFLGGAMNEAVLSGGDDALVATARGQLAELLGVRGEPLFSLVARYPKAMPQYQVGHLARVEAIEQAVRRHPGLALAGGAYRGVGIADCVHSGESAIDRLLGIDC
jgi:oxygen-dependent protoporphyrinogen oxidase